MDRAGQSKFSGKERKEFLKQVWTLYRDLNAWPLRVAKFLSTGASGYFLHMAILWLTVRQGGWNKYLGNTVAFACAMRVIRRHRWLRRRPHGLRHRRRVVGGFGCGGRRGGATCTSATA